MKRPAIALLAFACLPLAGCGNNDALPAVGTLERDRIELSAESAEPIAAIPVREGQHVESGQTLVRLDDARLQAELAARQAAVDEAEARLRELVNGPREEEILELRSQLEGAESTLRTRRREYERAQRLQAKDFTSASELDRARARRDAAAAERDALHARLQRLLAGTRIETLDQARAGMARARANVRAMQVRLQRLTLQAPVAGVVDALPFEIGERPPAGATLAVLLAGGPPYARIYLPQPLRARLRPGMRATVSVAGTSGRYAGRVRFAATEAAFTPFYALTERDRGRLSYPVEVDLTDDAANDLPSGMPVTVDFPGLHDQEAGPDGG